MHIVYLAIKMQRAELAYHDIALVECDPKVHLLMILPGRQSHKFRFTVGITIDKCSV